MGREFRSRMRGGRSYVVTGAYTLVVMLFVLVTYWVLTSNPVGGPVGPRASDVGRGIWTWGCVAQALLLPLLVPAFTCGAITLERERDLLELLLLTRQSPFQICVGKLGSGVGLGLTLVLASVPVLSLSLLLGGVAPTEIAQCLAVLVSSVLAAGALGLVASCLAPKTVTSTVFVYVVIGFGLVGMPMLLVFLGQANALNASGSDLGIISVLTASLAATFPPAVGATVALFTLRRKWRAEPPTRPWWMGVTGLCWAGLLLFLYIPGVSGILLEGGAMLLLHPVAAVLGVMVPEVSGSNALMPNLWWICTFAYVAAAVWFFYVAVLRVRRLRVG